MRLLGRAELSVQFPRVLVYCANRQQADRFFQNMGLSGKTNYKDDIIPVLTINDARGWVNHASYTAQYSIVLEGAEHNPQWDQMCMNAMVHGGLDLETAPRTRVVPAQPLTKLPPMSPRGTQPWPNPME